MTRAKSENYVCPSCSGDLLDGGNYCGWCGWNDTYGDHGVEPAAMYDPGYIVESGRVTA